MNFYYYTEVEGHGFIVASTNANKVNLSILGEGEVQSVIEKLSDQECRTPVSVAEPIAVTLKKGFVDYLSFMILVRNKTHKGRGKVIYGCTSRIWVTDLFGESKVDNLREGLEAFARNERVQLSFYEGCLERFKEKVNKQIKERT